MDTKLGKKDVLQAVVLADDFTMNLTPVQNIFPSILMPVINIPLLEYLIETLIRSRVQEVFLYCSNHIELLKSYVKNLKCQDISVTLIVSDGCRSLGDALRDIDTKGWIRGHFILIRGDAFVSADLRNALNAHLTKVERDKGAAMTMLLQNVGSTDGTLIKEETCIIVSDRSSRKILFHKKLKNNEKKVKLELNWFLEHSEIDINTNFIDTHVYLCSPSVLPLFADNFDYQTMEDFIRGTLMNEEILDSRIYWQQQDPEDYSLPITSWKSYHILIRDMLRRYSFPYVPGTFIPLKNISCMPRNTYKHKSTTLAKGCILEKECLLGQNSMVGENTFVTKSTIGDNCTIGHNVKIKNSYVFSNSKIEDNCCIEYSILFSNCVVQQHTNINGCILSPNTKVDAQSEYNDSILESHDQDIITTKISDLDNSEEFLFFKDYNTIEDDDSSTDDSSSDEASGQNSPIPDDTNMFLTEVIDSLLRGYQDKLNCENLILEINSSRYAYNVTIREVTYNVIKAILSLPLHYLSETKISVNNQNYQKNLKIMVTYFQTIILNYVKTEAAQDDCLRAIEDVAGTTQELLPFLQHLLHIFYDRDVLSEEKILEWYESSDKDEDVFQSKEVREAVQPFIKWLQEAEEDSSESD